MSDLFARRLRSTPRSFIREILSATSDPNLISFAGGLPEPSFFPMEELQVAVAQALHEEGALALQYASTEGYLPLREWIADTYVQRGLPCTANDILITSGSQQGLDLVARTFLDPGSGVMIERPSYLGALQAFALAEPVFYEARLNSAGPDPSEIEQHVRNCRIFYCVPEFQNPSGTRYSTAVRESIARALCGSNTVLVEDEPYREIYFGNKMEAPPLAALYNGPSVSLGSFSKTVAPGLRLGWLRAEKSLMQHILVVKQATDLHTGMLSQIALHRYLTGQAEVCELRLNRLRESYGQRRDAMVQALRKYTPITFDLPEGGMFLWARLPGRSTTELFPTSFKKNVVFVPGLSFFTQNPELETMRLNFTNSSPERIEEGVMRMASAIAEDAER